MITLPHCHPLSAWLNKSRTFLNISSKFTATQVRQLCSWLAGKQTWRYSSKTKIKEAIVMQLSWGDMNWIGAFIKNERLFWILEVHLDLNAYSVYFFRIAAACVTLRVTVWFGWNTNWFLKPVCLPNNWKCSQKTNKHYVHMQSLYWDYFGGAPTKHFKNSDACGLSACYNAAWQSCLTYLGNNLCVWQHLLGQNAQPSPERHPKSTWKAS